AQPGERVVDLGAAGGDERHRPAGRVTGGGATRDRYLLVAGEERLLHPAVQQTQHVTGVVEPGQLPAYRATRELLAVQVQVEPGRVGAQRVRDGRVADGEYAGRGGHRVRHRGGEQRYLDVAVHPGHALVDVAQRRGADALPGEREGDPVSLDPDAPSGAAVRVTDWRLARDRYLLPAVQLRLQEDRLELGPFDAGRAVLLRQSVRGPAPAA